MPDNSLVLQADRQTSRRLRPPLWLACFVITCFWVSISDVASLGPWLADPKYGDFSIYYSAANVGRTEGWQFIYDMPRYLAVQARVAGSHALFLETPPMAWLVVPLSLLPFGAAHGAWDVLEAAALFAAVFVVLDPHSGWRWQLTVVLALGFVPAAIALGHGEATLVVALSVAGALAFLRRGQQVWAGSALALICIKPHLGILVPLALLVSERQKTALVCLGGMVGLGAVSAWTLGTSGITSYIRALNYTFANKGSYLHFNTLTGHLGWIVGGLVSIAVVGMVIYVARHTRGGGVELGVLAAVAATLCVTNYVLIYDYTILMVAGVAAARHPLTRRYVGILAFAYLIGDFQNLVYPFPVMLLTDLGIIGLLTFIARREQIRARLLRGDPRSAVRHAGDPDAIPSPGR